MNAKLTGTLSDYYDYHDTDRDGIQNIDELGTCSVPYSIASEDLGHPPCQSAGEPDSDGDGVWDNVEGTNGSNPLKASYQDSNNDANGDGSPDSWILPDDGLNVPIL